MTWSRSGTVSTAFDGTCAYSAGPVEIAIPDGDGEIIIDTAETPIHLFDERAHARPGGAHRGELRQLRVLDSGGRAVGAGARSLRGLQRLGRRRHHQRHDRQQHVDLGMDVPPPVIPDCDLAGAQA